MNAAQIHLGLNHLPITLVLIGVPLLAIALVRTSRELKMTAAALLLLSALLAIPTYLSGEPTEALVEHRQGVQGKVIHEHEEAGEFALIVVEVLGALVLAASLFERFRHPLPRSLWWAIVAAGVLSASVFIRTAHLGGLIRHEELTLPSAKEERLPTSSTAPPYM